MLEKILLSNNVEKNISKNLDELTLLLHDIGKPHSYQEDGKFRHFKNHNIESEKIARKRLTELGYDKCFV